MIPLSLQKKRNLDALDQSAMFNISSKGTNALATAVVAAPLTE